MLEKLTALIITFNEVIHIDELISNLSFADEIIFVDSYSTDGTYEKLLANKNIKVKQHEFNNFADQKNYALKLATNDWILFIDADERISRASKTEVLETINDLNNKHVAYYSLFRYYFGDTPIKYSGFQTAKSFRLFKKSKCKYDETKIVHENLIVCGKTSILKYRIKHYSFRNYYHYKEKMELYATLKAKELHKKGKKTSTLNMYIKSFYRFFNHYIMRLGIIDGKIGYYVSYLNAYGIKRRHEILKELNRKSIPK